jgi:hypothetical protein
VNSLQKNAAASGDLPRAKNTVIDQRTLQRGAFCNRRAVKIRKTVGVSGAVEHADVRQKLAAAADVEELAIGQHIHEEGPAVQGAIETLQAAAVDAVTHRGLSHRAQIGGKVQRRHHGHQVLLI